MSPFPLNFLSYTVGAVFDYDITNIAGDTDSMFGRGLTEK